ncbi:hypothetical protein Q4E40_16765 [Pontibacter sp. BT731]|nr:hypothetical protein [Pontibacter sp. BT731]MDO6391791.1 hypothetical protein [Pontibacter sp. BT731]
MVWKIPFQNMLDSLLSSASGVSLAEIFCYTWNLRTNTTPVLYLL